MGRPRIYANASERVAAWKTVRPRIEQEAADRAVTRVLDALGKDIDAMPWEYRGVDLVIRVKEAIEQHRPKGGPGMSDTIIRDDIDLDIVRERWRQNEKWGVQRHPNGTGPGIEWLPGRSIGWLREYARERCQGNGPEADNWFDILMEEVFEAAAERDDEPLRRELIQVAAVVKAWIETIDTRPKGGPG